MKRSIDRSSDRTLPPLSTQERAAGARGGTLLRPARGVHGKPEPPPGFPERWNLGLVHGPTGQPHHPSTQVQRDSHGPPRQARGDPPGIPIDWGGRALHAHGRSSGPIKDLDHSGRLDSPPFGAATGPPGSKTSYPVNHWPPPWLHAICRAPPGIPVEGWLHPAHTDACPVREAQRSSFKSKGSPSPSALESSKLAKPFTSSVKQQNTKFFIHP